MKHFVIKAAFVAGILLAAAGSSPAQTSFTQSVVADTTMDGFTGIIIRATEPGFPTEDVFAFIEAGMYRVYAFRVAGGSWTLFAGAQYYAPTTSMTIGQSWRGIDTDIGQQTTATVAAFEQVTVPAGTFMCYRIDVTVTGDTFVFDSYWLSSGVGLVKEFGWDGFEWNTDELTSFVVAGSGFFPEIVGNLWNYSNTATPVQETTWGGLKAQYR